VVDERRLSKFPQSACNWLLLIAIELNLMAAVLVLLLRSNALSVDKLTNGNYEDAI
jgi:hypothetical protein